MLVASSTNSATLWEAPTGILSIPLSSAASVDLYDEIYVAMLYNNSAQVTAHELIFENIRPLDLYGGGMFHSCELAAQTTLPASIPISSLVINQYHYEVICK